MFITLYYIANENVCDDAYRHTSKCPPKCLPLAALCRRRHWIAIIFMYTYMLFKVKMHRAPCVTFLHARVYVCMFAYVTRDASAPRRPTTTKTICDGMVMAQVHLLCTSECLCVSIVRCV